MRIRGIPSIAGTLLVAVAVHAQAADSLHVGAYENPNGELVITAASDALKFKIDAVGTNGHTCSLDGDIRGNRAELVSDEDGPCVVTFQPGDKGVEVQGNDACRAFCGMRAHFNGMYFKPSPGCAGDERERTHATFTASYAKKDFASARGKLEPLLTNCAALLSWLETASIRNDLAVTLYHLQDRAACLSTLQPLASDAAKTDDAIRENYPPTDADDYLPLIRAARTNLKLCKALPSLP